ncbi:MAG: Lpg1974 family pore-forming outer membrane protein [Gemmataceae bacterium]
MAIAPALPGPYFEPDPLLDPPPLPQPGCFADAEVGFLASHIKSGLGNSVLVGNRASDFVQVPVGQLDWTASPRLEFGYRLPSGFGGFSLAYRFLATDGSNSSFGPDSVSALRSRLDVNVVDCDYSSWEISLWPKCEMKWRLGMRYADVFFDAQAEELFALAAAGSGVFQRAVSNSYVGFGPHVGVELCRHLEGTGISFIGSSDFATLLGRIRQGFFETSTAVGPMSRFVGGETRVYSSQAVPILNVQIGVAWQPPTCQNIQVFLGYQYEHWWTVGRLSALGTSGELMDQGIVLRAGINF